jgi:hypothetical protein
MARSTHDRKQAVLDFLGRRGEASLQDIAAMLGPEFQAPAKNAALRQMLRRMVGKNRLRKIGHGTYALPLGSQSRPLDNFDARRKAIREFLVERCVDVATGEIHAAVGWRNLSGGARDYDHQLTHRVLREAPEFCQPFKGEARWWLIAEERERLPLLGERADHEIQVNWQRGGWGGFTTGGEARADFFDSVGTAFMDARGGLTLRDVVSAPGVGEALRVMAERLPSIRHEAVSALDREFGDAALNLSMGEEWMLVAENLYDAFQSGDVRLHLVAPPEFYRSCARLFRVCPARLSRGDVVPVDGRDHAGVGRGYQAQP